MGNVRLMTPRTVFGACNSDPQGLIEHFWDHLAASEGDVRRRHVQLHAPRCMMATGPIDRPIPMTNNDWPGLMPAGALRARLDHYAVLPGRRW